MAVILAEKKSTYGSPYAYYKVETTNVTNRTAKSVDVTFKVTSHLASSSSSLGRSYDLTAGLYLASKWYNFKIKDNESWSGTTNHTKTQTITITGLSSSATSITGIKFRVVSSASDDASGLNATACSNITIPLYHTPPVITGYSIEEQNQILIDAGIDDDIFVTNLSKKLFDINYTLDNANFKDATIYNATTYVYDSNSLPILMDLTINPLRIDNLGVPIFVSVTDSEDTRGYFSNSGGSVISGSNIDYYNYILYNKISITSTTRAKRVGQTSGQAALDIDGACFIGSIGNISQENTYSETEDTEFLENKNYYMLDNNNYVLLQNGIDYNIGDSIESYFTLVYEAQPYKPLLKYKYWKYGDNEPETYEHIIPSSEISVSNGIFSVKDYEIGSTSEYILTEDTTFQDGKTYYTLVGTTYSEATVTVGDTIPSNTYYEVNPMYFDPRNAYRVKVYAEDSFTNIESTELQIQKGKALWSEYENRIDIEKLTIDNENIITIKEYTQNTGAIASGSNGSLTYDVTKEGYVPIGIMGFVCDGTRPSYISIFRSVINNNSASIYFKNTHPSSALGSDTSITIYVAYIRS